VRLSDTVSQAAAPAISDDKVLRIRRAKSGSLQRDLAQREPLSMTMILTTQICMCDFLRPQGIAPHPW